MMLRRLSLAEHGAVELVVGVALIAAPLFLGFGPAGLLASMAAGALAVTLAAHGDSAAGGVLAAAGAGELTLGMATRWTRRGV